MTAKSLLATKFLESLSILLAPFGYRQKDERTFVRQFDSDIYGMLTVAIDVDRDPGGLYFMLFAGVGAKRVRQTIANVYAQKPKYNIPLLTQPLSSFGQFERLSETLVCSEDDARKLAMLYAGAFKEYGLSFIENRANYDSLLRELREGHSGIWEDRAERRLAVLALTNPSELVLEYEGLVVEGQQLNRLLERVADFYQRLVEQLKRS